MSDSIPRSALWLGLGGIVPFAGLAAAPWFTDPVHHGMVIRSLVVYAAVILTFVGAIHWGVALHRDVAPAARSKLFMWSVVPALIAWAATHFVPPVAIMAIVIGFALQLVADRIAVRSLPLPRWFWRLRIILTSGVVLSLALGAVAFHVVR
ncbi:MAG: DUF3429 domain-containing protein [Pseudomonadota bacterium]